ncbi:hypothetical protein A3765_03025 [Oleiphilus sp. HI0130]|uniref:LuxR C-terminal-related transcriptional regulator n=1 Tax=unclassified Oleiphilus TaxID=2631174 RepID=UPI0007C3751D|nr:MULTISPECIES: LuxR C-terminal-related transcriptional regulator [unclassified Oleiphilus]KZY72967.1 hypothetical protein A3737_09340 [Oleiphilus sp. HI0065]KZY97866.1 hypothetical protein A3744_01440 [Oleiphilus sp. HI0073]KZZ50030.1 hypothetical protein A3760_14365 [Oleiphilus sp. HI0122]KZZ54748.1 hypothetical protein A3758_00400 [Oleiphilus sp. HI0118]KZZ70577.1 hypothetical protein A3765_03025 [Oleiphilus sp. HI0130]KZZ79013.1 hypothetical protein A3767_11990 [Oleiphilus sp. HI0133]
MTNYILRQDLLALLKKGREHPLTLTVAPAGSGKTTLLEQYRAHLAQYEPNTKVCFLNVSDRHNDNNGHNLFVEMFEAVKNIMPLWDEQFFSLYKDDRETDPSLFTQTFRQALNQFECPLLIVLDDFHEIKSTQVHHIISKLIDSLPDHVNLIISCRDYPELPITRMKINDRIFVLDSHDFKLNKGDLERLNCAIGAPQLDAGQVVKLLDKTDGWFVGAKMALLAFDKANEGSIDSFDGTQLELLDYFGQEVVHRLTREQKDFVLATSVCNAFNRDICENALMVNSANAGLEEVRMQDLFLRPDPQRPGWYRYHPLLRDVLLSMLERQKGRSYIAKLHLSASRYFIRIGELTEAVYHAKLTADRDYHLMLLGEACSKWVKKGDLEPVVQELNDLSDDDFTANSQLLIYQLYALIFSRRFNQASYYLDVLIGISSLQHERHLAAYCVFFQRILSVFQNDSEVEKYSPLRSDGATQTPVEVRAFDKVLDAYFLMCHGQLNKAFRMASEVQSDLKHMSHDLFDSFATPIIILCDRYLGRGIEAVQHMSKVFNPIRHGNKTPRWVNLATGMMVVEYEQNQLKASKSLGAELVPLVNHACATEAVVMVYLYSSRIMHIEGDSPRAARLLEQLERILSLGDNLRFSSQVVQEKMRQAFTMQDKAECHFIYERYSLSEHLEKGALGASKYYEEWRERLSLAAVYWLISKNRLKQATELLIELADALDLQGVKLRALVARSNLTTLLFLQGNADSAVNALIRLIDRYGLVCFSRSVFDEAPGVVDVFNAGIAQGKLKLPPLFYETFGELLQANGLEKHDIKIKRILTDKELGIFELLLSGATNEAISEESGIAVSTTKWHLKNIYNKLGVKNRTEAVSIGLTHS